MQISFKNASFKHDILKTCNKKIVLMKVINLESFIWLIPLQCFLNLTMQDCVCLYGVAVLLYW